MRDLLGSLNDKERQILTRFYLHEQSKEQICREMDLTDTQFRLAKSRAKQRLGRMAWRLAALFIWVKPVPVIRQRAASPG